MVQQMELIDVFIVWTITYLVSNALVDHDGPFEVFKKIRYLGGINIPVSVTAVETGELIETGDYEGNGSLTAEILECKWCASIYISLIVSIIVGFDNLLAVPLLWLVSAGATWFTLDLTKKE